MGDQRVELIWLSSYRAICRKDDPTRAAGYSKPYLVRRALIREVFIVMNSLETGSAKRIGYGTAAEASVDKEDRVATRLGGVPLGGLLLRSPGAQPRSPQLTRLSSRRREISRRLLQWEHPSQ